MKMKCGDRIYHEHDEPASSQYEWAKKSASRKERKIKKINLGCRENVIPPNHD